MSLDIITDKLLQSLISELDKEKNKRFIENELLKPVINKILDQLYPYYMGIGLLFLSMFVFLMVILFLNMRIFMCT